jgi:hypothetical protein
MQSRADRFPLRCPIEFRFRGPRGQVVARGVTVNIGIRGILFESPSTVQPGRRLEAIVALCATPGNPTVSKLYVQGIAVRCDNGKVAVAVKKHRLRPATGN